MGISYLSEKTQVGLDLRKHDVSLTFQIPGTATQARRAVPEEEEVDAFARILVIHAVFKASMQPALKYSNGYYDRCVAEVKAVCIFFPDPLPVTMLASFAAWLAFVCAMDDQLEQMSPEAGERTMLDCMEIVRGHPVAAPQGEGGEATVQDMARTLYQHCRQLLSKDGADALFEAACAVFQAHVGEVRFLSSQTAADLDAYMAIRRRTIALDPFFEVLKRDCLDEAELASPVWERLQHHVCLAAGLQNDLVGVEKDIEAGDPMNSVLVLLGGRKEGDLGYESAFAEAVKAMNERHNKHVAQASVCLAELDQDTQAGRVGNCIIQLCQTHLRWCSSAKRYQLVERVDR